MTNRVTFYVKQGRRYVPVREYDSQLMDAFPYGDHLISVYPGGASRRYQIDPHLAPAMAAARYAEDAMTRAVVDASAARPTRQPLTEEQQEAWRRLADAFGDELYSLSLASAADVARAGAHALSQKVDELLENPTVRDAYDQFMMVAKLALEQKNTER
jgi:hypothetical protein